MSKTRIILISAKAENGKDALAEYLQEQLYQRDKVVIIDHFAKYIKNYCYQMGWGGEKTVYWRQKLQQLGTEVIKDKLNYKAFHAKRLSEDVQILNNTFDIDYVLIPDCRFRDEVYTMKAMFPEECITIRINRIGHISKLTEEQLKHRSEVDLDDFNFDYVMNVEGGLNDLYSQADKILNEVITNANTI